MSLGRQLKALLRKDILIRKFKRHYIAAVFEYALPILIWGISVYIWVRVTGHASSRSSGNETTYDSLKPFGKNDIQSTLQNKVYYAPINDYTRTITENVFDKSRFSVQGCNSENDFKIAVNNDTRNEILLGLLFNPKSNKANLDYTMRWSNNLEMYTETIFDDRSRPRNVNGFTEGEEKYLWPVMYAIFEEHLKFFELGTVEMPSLQPLPTQSYTENASDQFLTAVFQAMDFLVFVTFVMCLSAYARIIMVDKETRLREMLRMMGLADSIYWTNAFLVGFLNVLPLCIIVVISLCVNFGTVACFSQSSPTIVFAVLVLYAAGMILLTLLISVLFNSAKLGSTAVVLAQVSGLFAVRFVDPIGGSTVEYITRSASMKLASCLLPPCALHWAAKLIVSWEIREIGATWALLFEPAIIGDNISLGAVLCMTLFSLFFWTLLILYLDAIVPWQYGMPKHPLFFARYSYWFPEKIALDRVKLNDSNPSFDNDDEDSVDDETVERSNLTDVVVKLNRITHNFGSLRAVDNLSLDIYGNQITVLLGHNGAGKTTAMNILTGLFPATRGDIYIHGHNARTNTKKAREGIGLCPQHNVLFDDLTVKEHLDFFAQLKSEVFRPAEIQELLSKLELNDKANTLAAALSGGMKRRLSLANAMVGNSSILILDEPTAGLDPEARRLVWTLLQEERTRRTVLMTTHYMEEADVLADRIAFVAKGKLMCAGSPMFLKRMFETGYKIRLTKSDQNCDSGIIVNTIKSLLPQESTNVHLVSDMSYEILINIGFPSLDNMIAMFKHLENNKEELRIESMGASVTTMEDVFLKVGQREEDLASNTKQENFSMNVFESFPKFDRLGGGSLILRQISSLFMMRFHNTRRDWRLILYTFVLPLLFSIIYMTSTMPEDAVFKTQTVTYHLKSLLGNSQGFLAGNSEDADADAFVTQLKMDSVSVNSLTDMISKRTIDDYFLAKAVNDFSTFKFHTSAGVLKGSNSIYFNGQPYHVGAAALADWQAAKLSTLTKQTSLVEVRNHPLEPKFFIPPSKAKADAMRITACLFFSVVLVHVAGASIITPIQERVLKSKLIQIMSGLKPIVYIGANFAFDGVVMLTALSLCLVVMLIFNPLGGFTNFGETIPAILLIFITFIFSAIPWTYVASYLFKSSTTGFSVNLSVNILLCLTGGIILGVFENMAGVVEINFDFYVRLSAFLPTFSAMWSFVTTLRNSCAKSLFDEFGIANLCALSSHSQYLNVFCVPCKDDESTRLCYKQHSVFNMNIYTGIGFQLLASFAMGILGFLVLLLIEANSRWLAHLVDQIDLRKFFPCLKRPEHGNLTNIEEDEAVKAERQAVYEIVGKNEIQSHALVVKDITKYYGSLKAVNNLSFVVGKNECFGLLGVNGAGKTSTFGLLTGDSYMNQGNAYIQRTDVRSNIRAYQEYIGYCPQFDALIDKLTGEEMLKLFCGLRGVPSNQVKTMIDFMTTMADLKPHINRLTATYSGGNKRKLSLAIAMIGNPSVLFLDEPTAGVDPGARRKIWSTLAQAQKELNSSVVLTSHSMDECEALCHRLVIMLRGVFRCLGSNQQIKSKYGAGFTVLIKTKATEEDQQAPIEEMMRQLFDGKCELKQNYQRLLQFQCTDLSLRWSEVFERIQKLRTESNLELEDVQVSDTTLEQVFLNFAQEDGETNRVERTLP